MDLVFEICSKAIWAGSEQTAACFKGGETELPQEETNGRGAGGLSLTKILDTPFSGTGVFKFYQ